MKELFIAAHEELIAEYLNDHLYADWHEAYEATSDKAYDRYKDKFAAMLDAAKDRRKYGL